MGIACLIFCPQFGKLDVMLVGWEYGKVYGYRCVALCGWRVGRHVVCGNPLTRLSISFLAPVRIITLNPSRRQIRHPTSPRRHTESTEAHRHKVGTQGAPPGAERGKTRPSPQRSSPHRIHFFVFFVDGSASSSFEGDDLPLFRRMHCGTPAKAKNALAQKNGSPAIFPPP